MVEFELLARRIRVAQLPLDLIASELPFDPLEALLIIVFRRTSADLPTALREA